MASASSSTHPKGLWVLFGTEMWERFNFYGMRALLTLFMVNSLGFLESDSSIFYGGFLALCYLTPMLGGFVSDKYLGKRKGSLSFVLNENTDAKNITSTYVDGLLRVIVPVKQPEVYNIDIKVD